MAVQFSVVGVDILGLSFLGFPFVIGGFVCNGGGSLMKGWGSRSGGV